MTTLPHSPFFSVLLTLYNAEAFVEEALESIAQQSFDDVELIISDDASTDGGVEKCRQWLDKHPRWKERCLLLTSPVNTGVTANMNRAVKAARGLWIKDLSADDALLPDALQKGVLFIHKHPHESIFQAVAEVYQETFSPPDYKGLKQSPTPFLDGDAPNQFKRLLRDDEVVAPTLFIRRDLLVKMDYYDESILHIDDWPLWIKMTHQGVRFAFMNEKVVKYRLHLASVSYSGQGDFYSAQFRLTRPVFLQYIYPHCGWLRRRKIDLVFFAKEMLYRYANRSDQWLSRAIYRGLSRFRKPRG